MAIFSENCIFGWTKLVAITDTLKANAKELFTIN